MVSSTEVMAHAMKLPEKERADLAHQLLLSLEPEDFDDNEIASAWQHEIESRLKKIADGNFHAQPSREAVAEIRQQLKKDAKP
jgi:putative addiction module component (TIGR02574 family)